MKTLFFLILSVVYTLGHLISPKNIYFEPETTATPTEAYVETATPAVPENPNPEQNQSVITRIPPEAATSASSLSPTTNTDAEALFGEAKVQDNFDRGSSGFGISAGLNDDENIRIIALNNRLSLEPKKNNGWISWRLRPPSAADSAVDMEFSIVTCARGDRTGIMMRASDYNSGHGYYFSLACEGIVSIMRDSVVLDTADVRDIFNNNSGDTNILTATAVGNTLNVMLNGTNLLSVQDETYKEGFNGFFTAPQGEKTLTMDIISFKEYYNDTVN